MNEDKSDLVTTTENHKLLALTEHPTWGVFVKMVEHDLLALDSISSLVIDGANRDDLLREVEVRYHTILKLQAYIGQTITRAESAKGEREEEKSDIIKFHN